MKNNMHYHISAVFYCGCFYSSYRNERLYELQGRCWVVTVPVVCNKTYDSHLWFIVSA